MRWNAVVQFFRVDDDHPLTGRHVAAMVALFFSTIIIVNLVLAIFATGTFPGLVVKNSYVASQEYNTLLARARAQEKTELSDHLAVEGGHLRFRLTGKSGTPVRRLDVTAHAGRPASNRDDRTIAFSERADAYHAEAPLLPGRWIVQMEAHDGETLVFRRTGEIWIAEKDATAAATHGAQQQ